MLIKWQKKQSKLDVLLDLRVSHVHSLDTIGIGLDLYGLLWDYYLFLLLNMLLLLLLMLLV